VWQQTAAVHVGQGSGAVYCISISSSSSSSRTRSNWFCRHTLQDAINHHMATRCKRQEWQQQLPCIWVDDCAAPSGSRVRQMQCSRLMQLGNGRAQPLGQH
jgi:hypothetical protein